MPKVILRADCYVGGKLRKAGEEADVKVGLEADFSVLRADTAASLGNLKKADLLALAAERGVSVTADNNKDEIVAKLLDV